MKHYIILFIFLLAMPADARLGETYEQCVARYGEGTRIDSLANLLTYNFKKGDFSLVIIFVNNLEVCCQIKKINGKITDDDVQMLLNAESETGVFTNTVPSKEWHRDKPDGASFIYKFQWITIQNRAFDDALKAFNAAAKNKNNGF